MSASNNPIGQHWLAPATHPRLAEGEVHVWRVPLNAPEQERRHFSTLSSDEQTRARRLYSHEHGLRYTVAHSTLRHILGAYLERSPTALRFMQGHHGKPALARAGEPPELHFNLSHSRDLALVAVSSAGAVGVDVEWWRPHIQHLAVAERFFSERERQVLAALDGSAAVMRGFFTAWSRKEAYLKATGYGISRGLHHFDVSLEPHLPAALLADRLDASAPDRWALANIDVGSDYSAALVATRPVTAIRLFDLAENEHPT